MEPAITVQHVTKTYTSEAVAVHALKDVSLEVKSGEVLLLMGPSGSGKTTLLSIMGCILRPTSGSVRVGGREVTGLSERALPGIRLAHIGFVFQGFNLFPALTASENVGLALDLKRIRRQQAKHRVADVLGLVGLSDKVNTLPENLSGGQKQRVAIARAIAGDPDIILADEPTAALDAHSGRTVMALLRDLAHTRGRAVVIVTHDTRAVEFADRIAHIDDGKLSEHPASRRSLAMYGRGSCKERVTNCLSPPIARYNPKVRQ